MARHVRGHAVAAGHPCLASVVQETVRKILARDDVKPHKVHYYLERRDPAVETKMTEVLWPEAVAPGNCWYAMVRPKVQLEALFIALHTSLTAVSLISVVFCVARATVQLA